MSRRSFLATASVATVGVGAGVGLTGCVSHPVTGKRTLMLMSEQQEIAEDRMASPHQFSSDYGAVQDADLNAYVNAVGSRMGELSHRPQMPYSFRALNTPFINAYTFAAGSIGISRGLLLKMEDEASLAAVLGHEIAHVNMRHRAQSMSQAMLANLVVAGMTAYVQKRHDDYAGLAAGLGYIGSGALLASYSRQDEREADDLGMEYMVKAGHNPMGMVHSMDILRKLGSDHPSLVERMFASHPMGEERYRTAMTKARGQYAGVLNRELERERFMDHMAGTRRLAGAVEQQQAGSESMMKKSYAEAETCYARAIKLAPDDYAGLVMMANCQRMRKQGAKAEQFARRATEAYPKEPQAHLFLGIVQRERGRFNPALAQLLTYRKLLDGNPAVDFNCGLCYEKMGKREQATQEYMRFLQQVQQGDEAKHAYDTLVRWGEIKPQQQGNAS